MPGTLYVVATPIGNLEDITLRALRVLREVQLIAAEDTRRTARLLTHYSITTPSTSLHEHNEAQKTGRLIDRLRAGDNIALVSDAGTPLISDPGRLLVGAARQAGFTVVSVPGPSAIMAALSAAGVEADRFTFLGFPPRRSEALKKWVLAHLGGSHVTAVFFEAPHRIGSTLTAMLNILGDRPIIIGRELTKLHETLVEQPISAHIELVDNPRGEFTVIVPSQEAVSLPRSLPSADELIAEMGLLTENEQLSTREAARVVATRYGLPVNEVYRAAASKRR